MKKSYVDFRAQLVYYVTPEGGNPFPLETIVDGILERLVIAELLDPNQYEGWPKDGLVAPLLSDTKEATA